MGQSACVCVSIVMVSGIVMNSCSLSLGIATFVNTPDQAYRSLTPLLDFALSHIPEPRWTQTSL